MTVGSHICFQLLGTSFSLCLFSTFYPYKLNNFGEFSEKSISLSTIKPREPAAAMEDVLVQLRSKPSRHKSFKFVYNPRMAARTKCSYITGICVCSGFGIWAQLPLKTFQFMRVSGVILSRLCEMRTEHTFYIRK